MAEFHRRLEALYHAARINAFHEPVLSIEDGRATLRQPAAEKFFHGAGAVHGSVLFKMLDDAAFFAVQSRVDDVFVLTASFHVDFLRPVAGGDLRSEGRLRHASTHRFLADATVYDDRDRPVATGHGSFMRGRTALEGLLP